MVLDFKWCQVHDVDTDHVAVKLHTETLRVIIEVLESKL